MVVRRTAHVADDLPAEPARLPWLRADRRTLLREREHVDLARSPGRHLAAPVRRTPGPGLGQAPSDRGDPASAASTLEGHPADGARGDDADAQGPRQPEADAAVPRRRAESLRTAARGDRADHRPHGTGQPVAREGPAAVRRGLRHALRRGNARHHAAVQSRQAGDAGRRGRLGPAALRPAGRRAPFGQSRPGFRPRPARPGRDRPGHLRPPVRTSRLPRDGAVDPATCRGSGLDRRPARRPPRGRLRRRRAAGRPGIGPRRGLGAAGTPGPQEDGRGAQARRALGAGRP